MPIWEVAALLGHEKPGHTMTELHAAADPARIQATRAALDELLRAICVHLMTEGFQLSR